MVALLTQVAAVLLLAASTSALGPPEGSVGTLDFRYPDYIVQPLVSCPFEGVFPHPNDCTWYYRCYDRYGLGFYWRAYFQCEPGTVFSDTLDQCIFQGDGEGCASEPAGSNDCREFFSDCSQMNLCPLTTAGTAFIETAEVCLTSVRSCPAQATALLCEAGYVYDNTNTRCIQESVLCRPPEVRPEAPDVICEDQLLGCHDYQVCQGQSDPQIHRLCQVSKNCYQKGGYNSTSSLCEEGTLFNAFTNQCVGSFTPEDACPGNEVVPASDVPCVQETETCSVFTSCETRELFLGCSSYFMCGNNRARTAVCPRDQVFVARYSACMSLSNMGVSEREVPGGPYSPCMFTGIPPPTPTPPTPTPPTPTPPTPTPPTPTPPTPTPPTPTPPTSTTTGTTVQPIDINEYIDDVYVCVTDGDRPSAEGYRDLGCSERIYCDLSGNVEGRQAACDKFLQCQATPDGTLRLFKRRCRSPLVYFYGDINECGDHTTFGLHECPATTLASLTTTPAPTTTPTPTPAPTTIIPASSTIPNDVDVVISIVVPCRYDGEVPKMPENAAKIHCTSQALCTASGGFMGMQNTCEKYYSCTLGGANGQLTAILTQCPDPAMKFDLLTRECITPQTNFCGGRRFAYYSSPSLLSQTPIGFYSNPSPVQTSQLPFGNNQANALGFIRPFPEAVPLQSNVGVAYQKPASFVQQSFRPNTQSGLLKTFGSSQRSQSELNRPIAGGYVPQSPAPFGMPTYAAFGNPNQPIGFAQSNQL